MVIIIILIADYGNKKMGILLLFVKLVVHIYQKIGRKDILRKLHFIMMIIE